MPRWAHNGKDLTRSPSYLEPSPKAGLSNGQKKTARGQDVPGYGQGRVMGWNQRATSMFAQLRAGKGNLRTWKAKTKQLASGQCECGSEKKPGPCDVPLQEVK